jgi:hypothetical protein
MNCFYVYSFDIDKMWEGGGEYIVEDFMGGGHMNVLRV